ncbi:MAG: ubiquinol-cytochrome c reductase iron-sulfur subunit [Planctomycetaceae bacterium]
MTDPKPSTNDIMAKIRAKAAGAAPAESTPKPPADAQSEAASAPENPAAVDAAASSAPKSTADIMAAARASAKPAAAPTGTAAILAAAKKAAGSAPASSGGAAAKGPSDIMAAIRAKAGATPAAAVAADAGAKSASPAPQKLDPAKAAGLSAADMIKAARSASDGMAEAAPKVVLPAKPLPGKLPAPKAAAVKAESAVERRSVLAAALSVVCSWVVLAWSSMIAASTVGVLGVARFMMPNVLVEPPTKFKIGPPNDYAPGTVSTKWQAQFNIWVVNAEVDGVRSIYALSTVCTHLGCTPNWLEGEQKFKCPCHGSGFYKSGVNFEGPAPRPLERFGIRLAEDGMLEVDKSVKFQKELGQWTNPACFVGVT